jgi:hypothetical protein
MQATVERKVRLTTMATLGCKRRPAAARRSRRRSWTMASKLLAA